MLIVAVLAIFVAGCATPYPVGSLYTGVKLPVTATSNSGKGLKMGVAECQSILGLVAIGDASIEAAMRNGGITEVHHIDWEAENILGIIGKYKTIVYGK
jgi:hypothetical protein